MECSIVLVQQLDAGVCSLGPLFHNLDRPGLRVLGCENGIGKEVFLIEILPSEYKDRACHCLTTLFWTVCPGWQKSITNICHQQQYQRIILVHATHIQLARGITPSTISFFSKYGITGLTFHAQCHIHCHSRHKSSNDKNKELVTSSAMMEHIITVSSDGVKSRCNHSPQTSIAFLTRV